MIKVLITDDHPVVRRGIRQILEDDDRIGLINEASDGKELINRMIDQKYDVVLLDISLPGRSGLDMISQIKKIQPSAAVLVLSIHSEEIYALNALKYGASGYLTKSSAPEELIFAIHKVSQGEKYISPTMAEDLAEMFITKSGKPYHMELSARELEVLNLMAKGKTIVQISSELSLSSKTISTYRSRLLEKLKLKSTAELIRYALLKGL
jgi:two-component system, NarL family, invasion response regulator UvrY